MANHPNRSQKPRRVYLLQGSVCTVTVYNEAPAKLQHQIGHVWRSGPVHNNAPAPLSMLSDRVEDIVAHLYKIGYEKPMIEGLWAKLNAANAGDEYTFDGYKCD